MPALSESEIQDIAFTSDFLKECYAEYGPGRQDWVYSFNNFREVVNALTQVLRLELNLNARLLEESLKRELFWNIEAQLIRWEGHFAYRESDWVGLVREKLDLTTEQILGAPVSLSLEQVKDLGLIAAAFRGARRTRNQAMKRCLDSGLFLKSIRLQETLMTRMQIRLCQR